MSSITHAFLSLSIKWKLQLGFFMVTMLTTIYNRWLASYEMGKLIDIARVNGVDQPVIAQLEANHSAYIFNSFWESGLEFAFQFMIIGAVAGFMVKPIKALCNALKAVERGDLTQGVENKSLDEIGVLERSFNDMLSKLSNIMRRVDESGKQMGQSVYQIATISKEIAEVSKNEHSRFEAVSAATHEVQSTSELVQQLAGAATARARETEQLAGDGIKTVQSSIDEMEHTVQEVHHAAQEITELDNAASQIHDIIATIRNIAEQTNMLALNAAIEAARAGEQGRGFAVVADEVRKLAERTTNSTGEISAIIAKVTHQVGQASAAMGTVVTRVNSSQQTAGETASVIERMAKEASQTATSNDKISIASADQLRRLGLLQNTLDSLFSTLKESSGKVEITANIGNDLYSVTQKLNALMSGFVFDQRSQIDPSQNDKRQHPRAENHLLVKVTQGTKTAEGVSCDISLTGTRLRLPEALEDAQEINMAVYLPHPDLNQYRKQTPLPLKGRIVWHKTKEDAHHYGVQFLAVNDAQKTKLRACFDYFNQNPEFGIELAKAS